jgi:hypothetical protein
MRTNSSIQVFASITLDAERLESFRKVIAYEPAVKGGAALAKMKFSPMFCALAIYVINC